MTTVRIATAGDIHCGNEATCACNIGVTPGTAWTRVARVRAVAAVAGQTGWQQLTRWRRRPWPTVRSRDHATVKGIVERAADADVVER